MSNKIELDADVVVEQKGSNLDLKIRSLSEELTLKLAKKLGENGKDADIFGYMIIPGAFSASVSDKVQRRASFAFGEGCQLCLIHPYATLPENMRKMLSNFEYNISIAYCVIYKKNE